MISRFISIEDESFLNNTRIHHSNTSAMSRSLINMQGAAETMNARAQSREEHRQAWSNGRSRSLIERTVIYASRSRWETPLHCVSFRLAFNINAFTKGIATDPINAMSNSAGIHDRAFGLVARSTCRLRARRRPPLHGIIAV